MRAADSSSSAQRAQESVGNEGHRNAARFNVAEFGSELETHADTRRTPSSQCFASGRLRSSGLQLTRGLLAPTRDTVRREAIRFAWLERLASKYTHSGPEATSLGFPVH